jgi:hypothetical protein
MKNFQITLVALFLSLMAANGQEQKGELSGSFTCNARYQAGKNSYLLDYCKVDYAYKTILADPVYVANMTWTRKNNFTFQKEKINYADLKEYPDLQKRFDLITPIQANFKFTILFYSDQSKAYIASAKSEIVIPFVEKAGNTFSLTIPTTGTWNEMFKDVVIGKQEEKAPGVVIPDAALEEFFKLERINYGKMTEESPWRTSRAMRKVFNMTNRVEIVDVEMEIEWSTADYEYITDELKRRKSADKLLASNNKQKVEDTYYDDRVYTPAVSKNSKDFWNTTVMPYEVWMDAIEEADKLYAQKKWSEAKFYYQRAADADPMFNYPASQIAKIQKYTDYKSSRNVRDLELVYVEGNAAVKSFYMGKTEITQSQWARLMGTNPSGFTRCRNCPVENVSWEDAQEFIKKLNEETGMKYRLPRLDEWEYAAKGGNKAVVFTQFSGSDNIDEVAWCVYNSDGSTRSVGQKTPNELGVCDMTGNVSEWTANQYDKNTRFVKGGAWADDAANSTITNSEKYDAKFKNNRIGFRVCQDE